MASETTKDTLKSFDPYRDENGQGLGTADGDRPKYDDVHGQLSQEPTSESEAARAASGFTSDDATEATEAETPAENIAHISDATLPPRKEVADALDRATASLGKE